MAEAKFSSRVDELHEAAMRATGLTDFGDPSYRVGMRVLLEAFDNETRFTERGRTFAEGLIVGTLVARLYTQEGWRKSPHWRQNKLRRPLVIMGIPRTGTTALHKLLSMDPQFQGLERWLAESPMVRPPRDTWETHPRYQATVAMLEAMFAAIPELRVAHDMVAHEVDECLEVLKHNFVSNRFGASLYVPSYDEWFFAQSELESYRRYADVLRLIGADEPDKTWLLKNPGHVTQIDALLDVFPDACIVQTHRDPVKAIPSVCSAIFQSRVMFEGERADPTVLGPRECAFWARGLSNVERARRKAPEQFHDVYHRDFHRDPLGTVRAIYEHFGFTLSEAAEGRMRAWIEANPAGKLGTHSYTPEQYGLTPERIQETYGDYIERHKLDAKK